jgi:hypothetical protein
VFHHLRVYRCDAVTSAGADLEHLIACTPVSGDLGLRRSAQRFERDTYHGDALPTELTGPVFSCRAWGLAWSGVPEGVLPTGLGEATVIPASLRRRLEAADPGPPASWCVTGSQPGW